MDLRLSSWSASAPHGKRRSRLLPGPATPPPAKSVAANVPHLPRNPAPSQPRLRVNADPMLSLLLSVAPATVSEPHRSLVAASEVVSGESDSHPPRKHP